MTEEDVYKDAKADCNAGIDARYAYSKHTWANRAYAIGYERAKRIKAKHYCNKCKGEN